MDPTTDARRERITLDPQTDRTFLRQLADFFSTDEVRDAVGEEDQKALLFFIPPKTLTPHVVHVEPTIEVTEVKTYDAAVAEANGTLVPDELEVHSVVLDGAIDATPVEIAAFTFTETIRRQVVTDCPDCRRGLTSRGFDMACPQLPRQTELRGCHAGCVVGCGADK